MAKERRDWRELCAVIAKEKNRMKLLASMEELLAVPEEGQSSRPPGDDGPVLLKRHGCQ